MLVLAHRNQNTVCCGPGEHRSATGCRTTSTMSDCQRWDAPSDGAVIGHGRRSARTRRSACLCDGCAWHVLRISRAGTTCRQHHSLPCLVARVPWEHCSGRWTAAFSGRSCRPCPFVSYASRRRSCMCSPRVGLASRACMDGLNGCMAGSVRFVVVPWHAPRARPGVTGAVVRSRRSGAP